MKKYTVFFSTDIRKLMAADGPERKAPLPAAYRDFLAANWFAPSLIELMMTKPDLNAEEFKFGADQPFLSVWAALYRSWDVVKAAYEKSNRGAVYVSLAEEDGCYTRVEARFGELDIILWMCHSSRPAHHRVSITGGAVIEDTRNDADKKFSEFANPTT